MHTFDLDLDHVTKIEGAATMRIKVRDNIVENVEFRTVELKRFFTEAMKGKPLIAIPQHLARVCGTCSNAHVMCAIEACENALGITPSEQTLALRKLTMHGLIIRDHALHLYLFSMPDIFNKDSFLAFDENDPKEHQMLHDGFEVKAAGNALAMLVAGRSVHATAPTVGGFLKFPDAAGIQAAIKKIEAVRPAVLRLIDVFKDQPFHFDRKTHFMALVPYGSFGYLTGSIQTSQGEMYGEEKYREHLEHVVLPYSQASAYAYQGEGYMVGSLARINLAKEKLHARTRESAEPSLKLFPSTDIYMNNLAQAIEILHSIDESLDMLREMTFDPEPLVKAPNKESVGVGVIEAPRGTLYHKVVMDAKGIVRDGEVVVPTGQNQINIERDVKTLVERLIQDPAVTKEYMTLEIEKLIRAYDPCMSCASHFLKIKWDA